MRTVARAVSALAIAVISAPLLYLATALVLGLLPVNAHFRPALDGIPVFVRTNGLHAEFVLPTSAVGVDWRRDHPATHMAELAEPLPWIAFGWGDRGFFVNTPTWADLRAKTALVALSGRGEGAMHVEYIHTPRAYRGREVRLSEEQYAGLTAYLRASFRRDGQGQPIHLPDPGYFGSDAFYAAVPRYSLWFTSNDWVRRGLTAAGVRAPRWAPFDIALFHQLGRI